MSQWKRSFILAAFLPLFAFAQGDQRLRDRDPDLEGAKKIAADLQQASLRLGPFYLLSRFRIADVGYSDSTYVPAGQDGGGLALSVEAPQRLYFVPHRKVILSAEVVPGYSFFDQGDSNGQFNYRVRGDAHVLLNRLYLDLYTQRADQVRALVSDINRMATAVEDETGLAGEVKYSSRTSALFTIRKSETSYPGDRFQPTRPGPDGEEVPVNIAALDRSETNLRLSLLHKTFPLTSLFVSAETSDYDFENADTSDSSRLWMGGGLQYDNGRSRLRLEAGPLRLDFDDPAVEDFQGVGGSIRVSRDANRFHHAASAERDLGFSIFPGNPYFIAHTLFAGTEYEATRRLNLRLSSTWQRDHYETELVTPAGAQTRRDTMSFTAVGFSYLIRRLRVGTDVGWYERSSTFGGDEDSGIRYVLHLSFTP